MQQQFRVSPLRRWIPLLPVLCLILILTLPSLNTGFVSDDFVHLVEDINLPITQSSDKLHRPLRNILLKVEAATFDLNPVPYRLTMIGLYLLIIVLLYHFILQIGGQWIAAVTTVSLFGFFPRNHQVIFWFAAMQDLIVGVCFLLVASFFLKYRDTDKSKHYYAALLLFLIALGFKETAVAILPTLVIIEVYRNKSVNNLAHFKFWRAYIPFGIALCGFVLYVFADRWMNELQSVKTFHQFAGFINVIKLLGRYVINVLLPFSHPVELRELKYSLLLVFVLLETATIIIAALALERRRELFLAGGWLIINLIPVALFSFYNDRYLFIPFVGIAFLLGSLAERIVYWFGAFRFKLLPRMAVLGLLSVYLIVSIMRLYGYQARWREAAQEVKSVVSETARLYPQVPTGSTFYFINLTHSVSQGQIYVLNNGLDGALWAQGYDRSVKAVKIFKSDTPYQQDLTEKTLVCENDDEDPKFLNVSRHQYIFIYKEGELIDRSASECANSLVKESIMLHPEFWVN